MSLSKLIAGDLNRPRLWFLGVILIAWNGYAAYRLTLPLRTGHEAFIARQIGRTGRNHLVLGLAVTRGANVTLTRADGSLEIHRSYAPLASWTVALPMAAGVDFDLAVRLPVVVSSNLFLVGLWWFVAARWGPHPAELALIFGVMCPVFLFSYGLTCIFEILALGPLMIALALLAQPVRNRRVDGLIALTATISAMYSWIGWVAIVPALVREYQAGRARAALAIGLVALGIPVATHFVVTGLASGHPVADFQSFLSHIAERSAARTRPGLDGVSYPAIVGIGLDRWLGGIGLVPLVGTVGCFIAVVLRRRRVPGAGWLVVLFALGLPLNLARNIAFFHDFFIILFVPVAAVGAALGTWWLATRFEGDRRRAWAVAAVLTLFIAHDVAPRYRTIRALPADYQQAAVAAAIGRIVTPDDFVIVNPALCGATPMAVAQLHDLQREQSPRPFYGGQLAQAVFVAGTTADAERIAQWARPGQRIIVLEVGATRFDLPATFAVAHTPTPETPLLIGIRPAAVATLDRPIRRR